MKKEYRINFEENGGEYTGHITLTTSETVSIIKSNEHYNGEIKIGDTHLEIDEKIDAIYEYSNVSGYIDITEEAEKGWNQ